MADVEEIISPDEKVLEVIFRHWINVVPIALLLGVLGLISIYGMYMLGRYGDQLPSPGTEYMAGLGLIALLAFACVLSYVALWVYRQNRLILTNKNLYQVTQNSLF